MTRRWGPVVVTSAGGPANTHAPLLGAIDGTGPAKPTVWAIDGGPEHPAGPCSPFSPSGPGTPGCRPPQTRAARRQVLRPQRAVPARRGSGGCCRRSASSRSRRPRPRPRPHLGQDGTTTIRPARRASRRRLMPKPPSCGPHAPACARTTSGWTRRTSAEVGAPAPVAQLDDGAQHDAVGLDEHGGAEAEVSLVGAEEDLVGPSRRRCRRRGGRRARYRPAGPAARADPNRTRIQSGGDAEDRVGPLLRVATRAPLGIADGVGVRPVDERQRAARATGWSAAGWRRPGRTRPVGRSGGGSRSGTRPDRVDLCGHVSSSIRLRMEDVPYGSVWTCRMGSVNHSTAADWTEAALDALARGGLAAVAVEPLAKALGATKGSFYWHFADRKALLEATLELWERRDTERVIAAIDETQDVETRLRNLLRLAFTSVRDGSAGGAGTVELALQASAAHPLVAPTLERVTKRRLALLTRLYTELGLSRARARDRGAARLHRVPRPRAGRARHPELLPAGTGLRRARRPGRRGAGQRRRRRCLAELSAGARIRHAVRMRVWRRTHLGTEADRATFRTLHTASLASPALREGLTSASAERGDPAPARPARHAGPRAHRHRRAARVGRRRRPPRASQVSRAGRRPPSSRGATQVVDRGDAALRRAGLPGADRGGEPAGRRRADRRHPAGLRAVPHRRASSGRPTRSRSGCPASSSWPSSTPAGPG